MKDDTITPDEENLRSPKISTPGTSRSVTLDTNKPGIIIIFLLLLHYYYSIFSFFLIYFNIFSNFISMKWLVLRNRQRQRSQSQPPTINYQSTRQIEQNKPFTNLILIILVILILFIASYVFVRNYS